MTTTDTRPPGVSPRRRRAFRLERAQRRRRLRRRVAVGVLGAALAAAAAVASFVLTADLGRPAGAPRGGVEETAGQPQQTLLLVRSETEGGPAQSVTLLASSREDSPALVLFLPVGTLVDIPGVGLDRLGLAHQYGGPALVHSTVENVLGVRVDHVAAVTGAGLAAWLDRVGALEVAVPSRLVERGDDGSADVRFEPGTQRLDGGRLAELWVFRERGEEELSVLSRQRQVLTALLAAVADDASRAGLLEGGAPQLSTDADPAWVDTLLAHLGAATQADRLRFSVLPVESFGGDGGGGAAAYRLREADTRELVAGHLSASAPAGGGDVVRVQVLNGVGVPGIGQEVDRRLEPGAFRIVRSDNASSFDFEATRIVVYEDTDASLAAARRVQELLGVGTIQVSRQPQSVVDVTIVVGADFVEGLGAPDSPADGDEPAG